MDEQNQPGRSNYGRFLFPALLRRHDAFHRECRKLASNCGGILRIVGKKFKEGAL